jgi:hypothetical protein
MVIKKVLKIIIIWILLQINLKSLNSQEVFPNYYKLFNIAIKLPINSATF